MEEGNPRFHTADYIVFSLVLLISAAIGVYYAVAGGRQRTTQEFLMADRSMTSLPVALSVLASFFSASTLLGTPAEIYQYGTQYWMSVFGAMLAPLTGALLFGPMFFRLRLVSVFEYLQRRFQSVAVRKFGAILFILRTTIGMGIVLFGPSTALTAVTQIPVWAVILVVGGVCTFYTTLGGLKAVIWTDVFQTFIMVAGMLAVLIQGCMNLGGMSNVWTTAEQAGRVQFFEFDTNVHLRHSFWSLFIGIYLVWLPPYAVDQQMIQRFSSARSLSDAKKALLFNVPGMFIIITLCSLVGVVMFSFYVGCDPLKTGQVQNANQLLPHFVMDIFGQLPGLPGLFVASLFSGALSSVSSMMNSLSAVIWEDFLKPVFPNLSEVNATRVTKVIAVCFGAVGIGMAFVVKEMGGTVLQASLTFNGAIGAPLVGLFILGACFTSANWIGALVGGLLGLVFPMWLGIGKYVTHPTDFRLPTYDFACNATTMVNNSSLHVSRLSWEELKQRNSHLEGLDLLYGISYIWFSTLGLLTVVIAGLVVSLITGRTKSKEVDKELLLHFFKRVMSCQDPSHDKRKQEVQTTKL